MTASEVYLGAVLYTERRPSRFHACSPACSPTCGPIVSHVSAYTEARMKTLLLLLENRHFPTRAASTQASIIANRHFPNGKMHSLYVAPFAAEALRM